MNNASLADCIPAVTYKLHANYHKKLTLGTYTVCHIPASTDWLASCKLVIITLL